MDTPPAVPRSAARDFDVVLFGATGFTGGLTADYLARSAAPVRWALAGRSLDRLRGVRDRLAAVDPQLANLELLRADAGDPATLAEVAGRTKVVASTVGPYLRYGGPLVAACAEAGTDYVDLTGEPEFVDRTWLEQHDTARETGARLVHCCGFDSIPHDLGARFTVGLLPAGVPITMRGVVRANGTFSGGTFHSALTALSRPAQMRAAAAERRRREPRPEGRSARAVAGRPHRDPVSGYWLVPLPTIDPVIVARSAAASPAYGPDFRYSHYAGTRTLRVAAGGAAGVASIGLAAQLAPLRERLLSRVQPGQGPSPQRRARSWFTVDFIASAADRLVQTKVSGGDPGYDATAAMLAESALCLALDDNPDLSGQLTPATAMGERLTDRLRAAGIRFDVVATGRPVG